MIRFEKVNRNSNGIPRVVCHFLAFIKNGVDDSVPVDSKYELALSRAKQLGGKKYRNKSYGGGIVFQCYNTDELESYINKLMVNI